MENRFSASAPPSRPHRSTAPPAYLDDYVTEVRRPTAQEAPIATTAYIAPDVAAASSPACSQSSKIGNKDELINVLLETVQYQSKANQALAQTAQKQMEHLERQMALLNMSTSHPAARSAPVATTAPPFQLPVPSVSTSSAPQSQNVSRAPTPPQSVYSDNALSVGEGSDHTDFPFQPSHSSPSAVRRTLFPGSFTQQYAYGPTLSTSEPQRQPPHLYSYPADQQFNRTVPAMQPYPQHAIPPTDHQSPLQPQGYLTAAESPYSVPRAQRYGKVEGLSFPNLTKEDETQYMMLRMALINLLPPDESEHYKYHLLLDHLKVDAARRLALAYSNAPNPFTCALHALDERYGQPRQLAQKEIRAIMELPNIRQGDGVAFDNFALRIHSLVGLLQTLGHEGYAELSCGSHVERLLEKLPADHYRQFKRYILMLKPNAFTYNLLDFSAWLQQEVRCEPRREPRRPKATSGTAILHGRETEPPSFPIHNPAAAPALQKQRKLYCPYCEQTDHFLTQCEEFKKLSREQIIQWIKANKRCWRCCRAHQAAQCDLKKPCSLCNGKHLRALHEVNQRPSEGANQSSKPSKPAPQVTSQTDPHSKVYYLDRATTGGRVLLKINKVILHNGNRSLETFAVLDDGSERTILLPEAARELQLYGKEEQLALRTVRHDVATIPGSTVSFHISAADNPRKRYKIKNAFTGTGLTLSEHSHPIAALQKRYYHLEGLPLKHYERARPLLLIGADNTHLITPIESVRRGPLGGPAALKTKLGWSLQGPARDIQGSTVPPHCFHLTCSRPQAELLRNVERLWQLDTLPQRNEKVITRSKQDQAALSLLDTKTCRVNVDGIARYATPLLRIKESPPLKAPKESVMPRLRSTEAKLAKNPKLAASYKEEIQRLETCGYVLKLIPGEEENANEAWYIPHHLVMHNNKDRVVFDCSFKYKGQCLNETLLPGPTLCSSLLGVLLRFRQHPVGISGDIKGMFHQVHLLPEDKPLLRFLWRDLKGDQPPTVYEWQVLPFGTTCSPCCAIYAVQKHVMDHSQPGEDVRFTIDRCFYVDNCLQSFPTSDEARNLIDKLRDLLAAGGFDLRQWASNEPAVISHLPKEARSESSELWLSQNKSDTLELTLGLRWHCETDTLSYQHRSVPYKHPTMRNIYCVLASQYDPLGYLIPYTTRAKVLVQRLWDKDRGWDDPLLPNTLLKEWNCWEAELQTLPEIILQRCYHTGGNIVQIHIFCDASEHAYGSVAYLRTEDNAGKVHVAFLIARSRVAPKRQLSIPRLELCAALIGAQIAALLQKELTLPIESIFLWSDSTTVLQWIN